MKSFVAVAWAVALLAAVPGLSQESPSCSAERAMVETGSGSHSFSVEIADDPQERSQGLMFRIDLSRDEGMLFLFEEEAPRAFWMKNTPLPLDIIFINKDGAICGMVERATPYTTSPRRSGCDAIAVLEVNGGVAEDLGIEVGDVVRHPFFAGSGCEAG